MCDPSDQRSGAGCDSYSLPARVHDVLETEVLKGRRPPRVWRTYSRSIVAHCSRRQKAQGTPSADRPYAASSLMRLLAELV